MKSISFVVFEKAVGQPRPRACIRGRHAGMYDPGTANDYKAAVRKAAAAAASASGHVFDGPVRLSADIAFERPKSHIKSNGDVKLSAPFAHVSKPDLDNILKAIKDAITNSGIWTDDSLVVRITASKTWGYMNQTTINITDHIE
jgi:Holliday junction resolvase RusA-like endonuclease